MRLWHWHRLRPQWTHTVCKTSVLALNQGVQQLITWDSQWFCWELSCSYSLISWLIQNSHPLGRYQKEKGGLGRRLERKESKGIGKELCFDILWCFCSKVSLEGVTGQYGLCCIVQWSSSFYCSGQKPGAGARAGDVVLWFCWIKSKWNSGSLL